jgi:2-oxoglutarate dehydrogenase E2 component (dihydrolipoamide succinyltransferase)
LLLQIDVAVNAPESGTIKEFLVNEEDTVTVGQDLVKLEVSGAPQGSRQDKGGSEPKRRASEEESTSSNPEPQKEKPKAEPQHEPEKRPYPPQEKNPEVLMAAPSAKPTPPKALDSKAHSGETTSGNRDERRVCSCNIGMELANQGSSR